MKKFNTLFRADDKWENLSICAKTKKEAKKLAVSTYEEFKKCGFIKNYGFISVWEI